MPQITIDGRDVQVEEGATILDAARKLGIDIPTLCHYEDLPPNTSCLVCVVKLEGQTRLLPSCAVKAEEGMRVESETQEIWDARRTALELLFSDHVGDCYSPCQRICPLDMNVALMIRQIQEGHLDKAIEDIRRALPMPGVSGRICPANCEQGCRRAVFDQPASIRSLERHVADTDRESDNPHLPVCAPDTGKKVAIVGAGPTGLSAAYFLRLQGHQVTVLEAKDAAGGILRDLSEEELPQKVLDSEIDVLRRMGVELRLSTSAQSIQELKATHDAVLLAVGSGGDLSTWTLPTTPHGLKVNTSTYQTEDPAVFAAGDAVRPQSRPIRSMAEGKRAATAIDQLLSDHPVTGYTPPLSSTMGRLKEGEIQQFLQLASRAPGVSTTGQKNLPLTIDQATTESSRCLHCDCRSAPSCTLRIYAERYAANTSRHKSDRRLFHQHTDHPHVIFEPGKCILCGICIALTEQAREELGLTFIGRGFDVQVAVPFDHTIGDGLRKVAARCIEACPTGALARRDEE